MSRRPESFSSGLGVQLRRQAVAVPAETALDHLAAHGLVARHEVLHEAGDDMAVVREAVGEGRAVIEDELRRALRRAAGRSTLERRSRFPPAPATASSSFGKLGRRLGRRIDGRGGLGVVASFMGWLERRTGIGGGSIQVSAASAPLVKGSAETRQLHMPAATIIGKLAYNKPLLYRALMNHPMDHLPPRSLAFLMHDVVRLLRHAHRQGARRRIGLTSAQWRVLASVARASC